MTPKEKAIQLVEAFRPFTDDQDLVEYKCSPEWHLRNMKLCAKIVVAEIVLSDGDCPAPYEISSVYWLEVNKQIELL